jgi:DNA gyrase subunit A
MSGYIKKLPIRTYRAQKRGGKGKIGMEMKEEDIISDIFTASTHDYVLFFSNKGKLYWLKVYEIPTASRHSKGKAIVNLLNIEEGEAITANIPVKEFGEDRFLFMATKLGMVKKIPLSAFARPRKKGIKSIGLAEGDELVGIDLTDGNQQIMLATKYGKSIRFFEDEVRPMGRTAQGVKGIRLREKDFVIGMEVIKEGTTVLTVTENGYGKRTKIEDYPVQKRGGKGVINIIPSVRNGPVVDILSVMDEDEMIMISMGGVLIRQNGKGIPVIGRNTQGVRLMRLEEGDKVAAITRVLD